MEAAPFRKSLVAVAIAALSLGGIACATTGTTDESDVAMNGGSFGTTAGAIGTMDQTRPRPGVSSATHSAHGSTVGSGTASTSGAAGVSPGTTAGGGMSTQPPNVNTTTTDRVDTPTNLDRTANNETPATSAGVAATTGTTATTTVTTTTATTNLDADDEDATVVLGAETRRTMRKD